MYQLFTPACEVKLRMTRSFGDFYLKQNKELPYEEQAIIAVPEVLVHTRTSRWEIFCVDILLLIFFSYLVLYIYMYIYIFFVKDVQLTSLMFTFSYSFVLLFTAEMRFWCWPAMVFGT